MSGHSKWATTKHKKALIDSKRAKNFTKLLKEIFVAAKLGDPNPSFNPRLRLAVDAAKKASMPKQNIEGAIKKATAAGAGENYDEMRYEGRGPGGIAIIVEALTDNKNRTAASIRSIFAKHGGALGETGSVGFMFEKVGEIVYESKVANADEMFEAVVEAGADNVESFDDWHEITTSLENFIKAKDALMAKYGEPEEAKIIWKAKDSIKVDDQEKAEKIMKLVDKLEDDEDVQEVYGNYEISEEIMESIGG